MRKSDSAAKLAHFTHNRFFSRRLWLIGSATSVALLLLRAFIFAGSATSRCEIPRIIHQTWKNDLVSYTAAQRIRTWIKQNPSWEYRLWTNEDNMRFMSEHYPQHLAMFQGYKQEIKRADAVRYFLLDHRPVLHLW